MTATTTPEPTTPEPTTSEPTTPEPTTPEPTARRVVVLASGSGTLLQALLDDPDPKPYAIVAVGTDLDDCPALDRARAADIPTFSCRVGDHPDRVGWNAALADEIDGRGVDLVVLAGFMKLVGPGFLHRFEHRVINAHPSLLPAFPGMRAPAEALEYGVRVTGCTVFLVDTGVDAGPIVDQRAVPVLPGDDVTTLHERIKVAERALLVDVVTALTRAPYSVTGRKVTTG